MASKTTTTMTDSSTISQSPFGAVPTNTAPIDNGSTAPAGAQPAPMLVDVLKTMSSSSKLGADALDYIEQLNRMFADNISDGITSLPISTDKVEARTFVHTSSRAAINLVFADTYQTLDSTPVSAHLNDVAAAAKARDTSLQIVQSIVIDKIDYALAGKMYAFISNAFKTIAGGKAAALDATSFKGVKVVAITNIDYVREYIKQISPHAVPARDDIGVVLCIEQHEPNPQGLGTTPVNKPFLAMTGYTRVMNPQNTIGAKFIPVPTITEIASVIPNPSLLAMALPMATDAFIQQALWQRPYQTFRAGMPNLGNLIMDTGSKKPLFTDTMDTFYQFINTYMTAPFLAVDITEGRARALGIDSIVKDWSQVASRIRRFLGQNPNPPVDPNQPIIPPTIGSFVNYTGYYLDKGVFRDTRCVDYLELAAKVADHKQIEYLLLQPASPAARIEHVKGIYPDNTKALYTTTTVVFNAPTMIEIGNGFATAGINLQYDMPASGNININTIFNGVGSNTFANFPSLNTVGRQQPFYRQGLEYANLI